MSELSVEVLEDADAVFRRAATYIAERVRSCVDERGEFSLALSGGRVQPLLELLDAEDVPWDAVTAYQVDERVAPRGHEERNLTQIEAALTHAQIVPSPVEDEDAGAAASRYARCRPARPRSTSVSAPTATASLVPNCGALAVRDRGGHVPGVQRPAADDRRRTRRSDRARGAVGRDRRRQGRGARPAVLSGDEEIPAALQIARRCRQS